MSAAYLDQFADFICRTRYEDLTPSGIHAGKRVLLDNLGAIMRGSEEPENVKLSTLSRRDPGGRPAATLLAAGFARRCRRGGRLWRCRFRRLSRLGCL